MINAKGEVIGAAFDGNIHSLGGSFGYDPEPNRTVTVSTAAITEALRNVYNQPRLLRELGVRDVDTADSGEQALRMCAQKRYDVILQDFHLGDGKKNGQQVLEDLILDKHISHECIFIMVTAESSQAIVLSAIEHEPDAYLTKPFNRVGLAQRVEKLYQRKTLLLSLIHI